jgi:hypothetical protein
MSNIHMALTAQGQILNAKIQAGNGTVPLEITRIVSADGYSPDPLNLTNVIGFKQTAQIIRKEQQGVRAIIEILLSNQGNPTAGEPPLTTGYSLSQFGMFAIDPDDGEVLYRISQYDNPAGVPAAAEMGWTINPTWNILVGNASDVIVNIDPSGMATVGMFNAHVGQLVMTEQGVHGIRYYDDTLEVWDVLEQEWVAIGTTPGPAPGTFSVIGGVLSNTVPYGTVTSNGPSNTLTFNPGFANVIGQTALLT